MRTRLWVIAALVVLILCQVSTGIAQEKNLNFGLINGSIVFLDPDSNSTCGAINTFNADFFIRSCDRRLILLTGDDRVIPYYVDTDYNVFRDDGVAAGRLRFATDNDGFRQVFWLSDSTFPEGEDFILNYIEATDQLAVATYHDPQTDQVLPLQPANISQTQCDPSVKFDGSTEVLCPTFCGSGSESTLFGIALVVGFIQCRRCLRGSRK